MTRVAICAVLAMGCALAHAGQWVVERKVDSMTDRERIVATTVNTSGFKLSFYRVDSGAAWVRFSLPDTGTDVLGSRLPMYRIDKKEPEELEPSKQIGQLLGTRLVVVEPKWVNFQIWAGTGQPHTGTLREFMEGTSVVFRYYLFTGGSKETTFDLTGAKGAIAEALGVNAEADPAGVQADKDRRVAFEAAFDECNARFPLTGSTAGRNLDCRREAIRKLGAQKQP